MGDKKVLVVDIDETLLNIEPLSFLRRFRKDYRNYMGKSINFQGIDREYYLVARPRIQEFIRFASSNFDVIAFSIMDKKITEQKLISLGVENFFLKIYGKDDLIDKKKSLKMVSKDLKKPLRDVIAIDDVPDIFLEKTNVISVKPFLMGKNEEYEYQKHDDNLVGALSRALSVK